MEVVSIWSVFRARSVNKCIVSGVVRAKRKRQERERSGCACVILRSRPGRGHALPPNERKRPVECGPNAPRRRPSLPPGAAGAAGAEPGGLGTEAAAAWTPSASPSEPCPTRSPRPGLTSASCPLAWGPGGRNRNSSYGLFPLLPETGELCGDRGTRETGSGRRPHCVTELEHFSEPILMTGKLVKPME